MKKRVRQGGSERQTYWEETMRRWKKSGQSVRAFCRNEGLRESAFYFWRRELAQRCHRTEAANESRPPVSSLTTASHSSERASLRSTGACPPRTTWIRFTIASSGLFNWCAATIRN